MQIDPKVVQEEPARDRRSSRPRGFHVTFNVLFSEFHIQPWAAELVENW